MLKQLQLLFESTSSKRRAPKVRAPVSDDFLRRVWLDLRRTYYPERVDLDDYTVRWSTRQQKRVLASCNIRRRVVVVARELFEPGASRWIAPVLYHELCHAVLGESIVTASGRRMWHGAQFRELEARHPDIPLLNSWIVNGGWALAVRSSRSRSAWARRRSSEVIIPRTARSTRNQ